MPQLPPRPEEIACASGSLTAALHPLTCTDGFTPDPLRRAIPHTGRVADPVTILPKPSRDDSRRPLAHRLAVRSPRLAALAFRGVMTLPPGRVRSHLIARAASTFISEQLAWRDYGLMRALLPKDFQWTPPADLVPLLPSVADDGVIHGREAAIKALGEWLDGWGEFRFEPVEIVDFHDGRVAVFHQLQAASGHVGLTFAGQEEAQCWEIRSGRPVRALHWLSWDQARADLGLRG